LSLAIVIDACGLIQYTILAKEIDFKTQAKVSVIGTLVAGSIGIGLALLGAGVWSLVAQQVGNALFRTICLWCFSPWRPAAVFRLASLREMFGFGSRLLFSAVLNQAFENIFVVVIGKLFSASDLGFFTRAKTLQEIPGQTLSAMVARVTFPVFSIVKDEPMRLKAGMKKMLSMLALMNFPLMIGLAIMARPLVLALLTEKWAGSIVYLQLLCVVGLLFPLHVVNLNVLQALGRSDLFLRLELIKKMLIVVGMSVSWPWGISGMICGSIVTSLISYYLNSRYAGILVGYPLWEQIHDVFAYLLAAVLMGIVVYGSSLLPIREQWFMLFVGTIIGAITYGGVCWLCRLPGYMEIWHVLRELTRFVSGPRADAV